MNMLKLIRSSKTGVEIIHEWLGEGGIPVDREMSCARAVTCEDCDQNEKGTWWETATNMVGAVIRKHLAIKNAAEISTPSDKNIGTCKVCLCNLPLKVQVPIAHIKTHTTPEEIEKFPAHCWIKKEIES